MKKLLLICDQPHIDTPLRRSLAHLVNSCYIEIICRGHWALDELKTKTFDLIIIEPTLTDIDCLELIESIEYLDPGLPAILMLSQKHRALWGPARDAGATPILRPFKPLAFLRLVDNLLHEQLERYRELAKTLDLALTTLSNQVQASLVFLVDGGGAILLATARADEALLETLARLLLARVSEGELDPEDESLLAPQATDADQELYGLVISENLYLGVLLSAGLDQPVIPIWLQLEVTGYAIKEAFVEYELTRTASDDQTETTATDEIITPDHLVIPLKLVAELSQSPLPLLVESEEEHLQVNWQIISTNSAILNRLQDFCQIS